MAGDENQIASYHENQIESVLSTNMKSGTWAQVLKSNAIIDLGLHNIPIHIDAQVGMRPE
jgi:hypothetical protein